MARCWTSVLAVMLASACAGAEAPGLEETLPALEEAVGRVGTAPDVRGVVREVTAEGWMWVESLADGTARRVRLGYETSLEFGGGVAGHRGDLVAGQRVSVWLQAAPEAPARLVMIEDEPDA